MLQAWDSVHWSALSQINASMWPLWKPNVERHAVTAKPSTQPGTDLVRLKAASPSSVFTHYHSFLIHPWFLLPLLFAFLLNHPFFFIWDFCKYFSSTQRVEPGAAESEQGRVGFWPLGNVLHLDFHCEYRPCPVLTWGFKVLQLLLTSLMSSEKLAS